MGSIPMRVSHTPIPCRRSCMMRRLMSALLAACFLLSIPGCVAAGLFSAMAQAHEDQKLIEVLPRYTDLEGQSVAVLVDAGLDILYDHPNVIIAITGGVAARIGANVPNTRILRPDEIIAWQWRTPEWNAMPYGQMAETLGVDRVVFIDLHEYRLNPPGNRWLWEGVCSATVGIIERDNADPDSFVDTFLVRGEFPTVAGVDRGSASANQIETGVLSEFIKETAWLFYRHERPKYPDRYRPGLNR